MVCVVQVAYIPPLSDIGPESRLVRFAYTIEDSSGNKLYGQTFDIEVQPVNNQVGCWCGTCQCCGHLARSSGGVRDSVPL